MSKHGVAASSLLATITLLGETALVSRGGIDTQGNSMGDGETRVEEYPYQTTAEYPSKGRFVRSPFVLLAMVAAIAGLLFLAYQSSGDSTATEDDAAESATLESDVDTGEEAGTDAVTTDATDDAAAEAAADPAGEAGGEETEEGVLDLGPSASIPAPDGAYVSARLNIDAEPGNGMFVLSGRVPDQETAAAVIQAAEISYAPFVQNELEVDPTLDPAPWLAAAPFVVGVLPSVTDGTIMVADQTILLSARSPNPDYLASLQGALGVLGGGLPVEMVDTKITDLEPPLFSVQVEDGKMTLSGYVPSEEVIALLAGGAVAAYGDENVTNELTVDSGTYRSFWMQTIPGIFQLFRAFPTYQFTVDQGQFSGTLNEGVNFAANSTEITETAAQALDIGVAILARDITIGMKLTGHTDSQGPDEYNQQLSLARAQSVIDYFVAAGIDPDRLLADGAGETQPIADNETPEGRLKNRRVEFDFGPASSLQAE